LGGLVQGEWIWGVELSDAQTWLWVNPTIGTLEGGAGEEILLEFDATDLDYGVYEAEIHFTTVPDVGSPVVDVTLNVTDMPPDPPYNLTAMGACDTMQLCWQVNAADSFSVYTFTGPGEYVVHLTTWHGGNESMPSDIINFEIPWPEDLEPVNFIVEDINNNIVYFSWDIPEGCATEDGYNIYRNGVKVNDEIILETSYSDTLDYSGTYEYYVTAVYYFGESDPSNVATAVITSIEEINNADISIYPNPAKDKIFIQSQGKLDRILLLNNLGAAILTQEVKGSFYQIAVSDFDPGIYFIRIETKGEIISRKIIIE
jgi:hypothetical protein